MQLIKKTLLPVLLCTLWISLSEFFRNQFLLADVWNAHYKSMGLVFPVQPINGAMWGIWSLLFAISIFIIGKKFSWIVTSLIAWLNGFVLMWVVIGNLGVLPMGILYAAVPLSLLEAFVATIIIKKLS